MECPKCNSLMESVSYQQIEVDRCTGCHGLWFDAREAERMKGLRGSEAIDEGDPDVGARYDKVEKIDCPRCHTPMIRMVDLQQRHIRYESCTVCHGLFFDAGEFKDYKDRNVLDFFMDLLAEERE